MPLQQEKKKKKKWKHQIKCGANSHVRLAGNGRTTITGSISLLGLNPKTVAVKGVASEQERERERDH